MVVATFSVEVFQWYVVWVLDLVDLMCLPWYFAELSHRVR